MGLYRYFTIDVFIDNKQVLRQDYVRNINKFGKWLNNNGIYWHYINVRDNDNLMYLQRFYSPACPFIRSEPPELPITISYY